MLLAHSRAPVFGGVFFVFQFFACLQVYCDLLTVNRKVRIYSLAWLIRLCRTILTDSYKAKLALNMRQVLVQWSQSYQFQSPLAV